MTTRPALVLLPLLLLATSATAETPSHYLSVEQAARPGGIAHVHVRARDEGGKASVHVFHVGNPFELLAALPDVRRIEVEGTPIRAALTAAQRGAARSEPAFGLTHVRSFETNVPSGYETHDITFEAKRPGIYLVEVDLLGQAAYTLVEATTLLTVTKRAAGDALVLVVDRQSGEPRPGVRLLVTDAARSFGSGGITGPDGTWRGALPHVPEIRVVAYDGPDVCLGLSEHYPASAETPRVYLTTERPLYRPGETVYFKGIARVPSPKGLVPFAAGEPVEVRVLDGVGTGVTQVVSPLNEHGTFSGSFEVPKGAVAGRFRLIATVAGGGYEGAFTVEDFRKPAFEVRVAALAPQVVGGDDVAARIRAELYSGGVVKGAAVQWSVLRSRFDRPSWLDVEKSAYVSEHEAVVLESTLVKQGTGTLDDKGELVIEVPTEKTTENWVYRIAAVVTGPDGQRVSGAGSVAVTAAAFRLAVKAEPLVVEASETVTIDVGARDYAERPVRAPVTVRALLLDTTVEPQGPARGGDVVRELHREVVTTDDAGAAHVTFSPGAGGHVQVVVESTDDRGNPISAVTFFWASVGSEALTLRADGLRILPDKRSYAPGDTARVMVVSPDADATLLLTEEGDRLLGYRIVKAKGNAAWIEIPVRKAHAPNVYLGVAAVRGGKVRVATRQLMVLPVHRQFTVELRPDKDTYRARESGRLTVTTRDSDGRPVSAEVSVAVVDQALFALSPKLAPDLLPFFVPRRRNGVGTDTSAATAFYGYGVESSRLEKPRKVDDMKEAKTMAAEPMAESMAAGAAAPEEEREYRPESPGAPKKKAKSGGKDEGEPEAEETREELVTTLLWRPHVLTGDDGRAVVDLTFSDDLTTWHIAAEAVTDDTRVGQSEAKVRTRQDLLVRLDPPTSLTERDELTLTAVVQNLTATPRDVTVGLTAKGAELMGDAKQTVRVEAEDTAPVSWPVKVKGPETLTLTVSADAGELRDALKVHTAVSPYGAPESVRRPLELAGDGADALVKLPLPKEALPDTAVLTVRLSSGPAAAIRAALPYLAEYPYGCVEQTMSRFVPLLAARGVLERLGASQGLPGDVDAMVRTGVARLVALQGDDGGWGWFGGHDADPLMSAYALYGLALARELGATVPDEVLTRAKKALGGVPDDGALPYATRTYTLYALTLADGAEVTTERRDQALRLFDTVDRSKADAFTQAQLILTLSRAGRATEAAEAAKDLSKSSIQKGKLVTWRGGGPFEGDEIETTAWALRALLAVDPRHPDVVPALSALLAARAGERWMSTRDTAAAILALTDVLAAGAPALDPARVTVSIAGKARPELVIDPSDVKGKDVVIEVREGLRPGEIPVAVEKSGKGVLVGEAALRFRVGGDSIPAVSSGLTVSRRLSRLVAPAHGRGSYSLEPISGSVRAGDVVQVELEVRPAAGERYVVLEDPRPSGFRLIRDERDYPVAGQTAAPIADHTERLADRTAFFFGRMDGPVTLRYLLRPELPGALTALPANATLMYRPEVSGRSESVKIEVKP